jgi:hypothetical protein
MDSELIRLAQRRLREGALPRVREFRTWGGPGSGQRCALCDQTIDPPSFEIEVGWSDRADCECSVVMHVRCQAAWLHALQDADTAVQRPDGEHA